MLSVLTNCTLAVSMALAPFTAVAQQQGRDRPSDDALRIETLRYVRDSVKASFAVERQASPKDSVHVAVLAATLRLPVSSRAELLRCRSGCAGTPDYLVNLVGPDWSGDTARVTVGWLRRETGGASNKTILAEGADEYLLILRNGRWKVVGIGRRVRSASAPSSTGEASLSGDDHSRGARTGIDEWKVARMGGFTLLATALAYVIFVYVPLIRD